MQEWEARWRSGVTPWNRGSHHPKFEECQEWLETAKRVWVPGCGHGHEVAFAASFGAHAIGVDGAQSAIQAACELYADRTGVVFVCEDALKQPEDQGSYDVIVDRAFLCALSPEARALYMQRCYERLRPGGVWMSVTFEEVRLEEGPPFAVTLHDVLELWDGRLSLVCAENFEVQEHEKLVSETLQVWQKPFESL